MRTWILRIVTCEEPWNSDCPIDSNRNKSGAWLAKSYVWARDRSAKMIYGDHVSTNVMLFHGSAGRELVIIDEPLQYSSVYLWDAQGGSNHVMSVCPRDHFKPLKMGAIQKSSTQDCRALPGPVHISDLSLEFTTANGLAVKVSWYGYIEPPR